MTGNEHKGAEPLPWSSIPPAKRFGRRLSADAVALIEVGSLLRFYSEDPWFDPGPNMPQNGEIVRFTGNINNDFPLVGPHLEVASLAGIPWPGGGWVYHLFQFVSDPPTPIATKDAELLALRGEVWRYEKLLREAATLFRFYETSHLAKNTQDGDEKAHRNAEIAGRIEAALTHQEKDAPNDR